MYYFNPVGGELYGACELALTYRRREEEVEKEVPLLVLTTETNLTTTKFVLFHFNLIIRSSRL